MRWTPWRVRPLRYTGRVETRVLPSPVFISATQPKCRAAPPMIWTSKCRWPSVRTPASRTAANASGRMSSRCSCCRSGSPALSSSSRQRFVNARRSSSERACISASKPPTTGAIDSSDLSLRPSPAWRILLKSPMEEFSLPRCRPAPTPHRPRPTPGGQGVDVRSPPMIEAAPARSARARTSTASAAATTLGTAGTAGMALAAAVGIGVFAWFRIWQARAGDPLVWQDSLQYQRLGKEPLLSHLIWAGTRPPVTPLLWKVAGNGTTFVLLQTLASVVAWSTLAVVSARRIRPRWGRLLAGGVVLAFASTRPITQWDRSVLSESLSLTLLALLFAVAIVWAARPTIPRGIGVVAVALVFAATRDTQIWVIAVLAVVFGAYAAWRGLRIDASSARPALVVAAGLVAVVVVTGASSFASHRDVRNVQNALAVRVFPYPSRIAWFGEHGMPQARRLTRLARATTATSGAAPVVAIDLADPDFRPLSRWLRTDAARTYVEWLVLHPGTVLKDPLVRPERTYNNAEGHLSF